jgi:hypothetical protein
MAPLDMQTSHGWQEIILCCACNAAYNILGLRRTNLCRFYWAIVSHILQYKFLILPRTRSGDVISASRSATLRGVSLWTFQEVCEQHLWGMDQKWSRRTMILHCIPVTVGQSPPNTFTPKNVKWVFLVAGIWPFNSDVFTEEGCLPSAVSDSPRQGSKHNIAVLEVSTSNSFVNP